jgi:hypothetical protein
MLPITELQSIIRLSYNYAFYLQDKMEYEGMVANVGVRIEAYNFQSNKPVDRFNPFYPVPSVPAFTEIRIPYLPKLKLLFCLV